MLFFLINKMYVMHYTLKLFILIQCERKNCSMVLTVLIIDYSPYIRFALKCGWFFNEKKWRFLTIRNRTKNKANNFLKQKTLGMNAKLFDWCIWSILIWIHLNLPIHCGVCLSFNRCVYDLESASQTIIFRRKEKKTRTLHRTN